MAENKKSLSAAAISAWLHLLKKTIIRYPLDAADYEMASQLTAVPASQRREIERWIDSNRSGDISESGNDLAARAQGKDWPATAETMKGLFRMDDLHACLLDVLNRKVPGDFAEAGTWRGGAAIMMRAVLKAYGDNYREVWVADSFEGCPAPDEVNYPGDAGDPHSTHAELAISLEAVKKNFERYGLLDRQVIFIPGWFRDTLTRTPIERLALLHLDCDMYESTIQALEALYGKVSPGGYVVVDDYGAVVGCRQAVTDFRKNNGIETELRHIDWTAVRWQVPENNLKFAS
jgi:O-methyltransferase